MNARGNASDGALAAFVEIKDLIEKAGRVRGDMTDNERAVFDELRARYAAFTTPGFEDKTLLEVMLRNVDVRAELSGRAGGRAGPDSGTGGTGA